ncbi:MAG: DUF6273 domain-containing protein [Lachnospiraceae bacterium]|nr:DUF6273 domain-containing protein [Lachnospiraceae bacterium]
MADHLYWPQSEECRKEALNYFLKARKVFRADVWHKEARTLAAECCLTIAREAIDQAKISIIAKMALAHLGTAEVFLREANKYRAKTSEEWRRYRKEMKKYTEDSDEAPKDDSKARCFFGSYPQSEDGENVSPIEWEILDDTSDTVILISRYILDVRPYQEDDEKKDWNETTLCRWLNHDFLDKAFTEEEKDRIDLEMGITLLSYGNLWHYYDNNDRGWLGTCGDDMIFSHTLVADPTPYALSKSVSREYFLEEVEEDIWGMGDEMDFNSADPSKLANRIGAAWWLRRDDFYCGSYVTPLGEALKEYYNSDTAKRTDIGVRPVIMLKK